MICLPKGTRYRFSILPSCDLIMISRTPRFKLVEDPQLEGGYRQRLYDLHVQHVEAKKRSVAREACEPMMLSDESIVQLAERVVASGTSPSMNLFRKELRRRVRKALAQMKAEDREVLVLRYLEQLDSKEIAAIAGVSEDAVNMRHLRALKRLRGLLGEALGEV